MTAGRGALLGILLAQGAPLGWYLLGPYFEGFDPARAIYIYLEVATTVVLGFVGWSWGLRHQHLQELNHQLEALARQDPLTGLANARALHESLQREVARAHRSSRPLSLILLDLDHFKEVNDQYGHLVGDQVLKGLGEVLEREARIADIPARYGGEELAVILPETDERQALQIAERLRKSVHEAHRMSFFPVHITASFGVAQVQPGQTPLSFFASADRALYRAKSDGRNCVRRDPVYEIENAEESLKTGSEVD